MPKLNKEEAKRIRGFVKLRQDCLEAAELHIQVAETYKKMARALTHQALADKYNVSKPTIQAISDHRIYADE